MYIPIRNLINTRAIKSSGRIKVLEFYPSVRNTARGVILPVSRRTNSISEIFRDFANIYKISRKETSTGKAGTYLSFDQYEKMLNEFINILKRNDREIIVSTAPLKQMYDTYKSSMEKFFVAGVVDIIDDSLSNPMNEIVFVPKEGENIALGFSTYVSIAKRTFKKLDMNISTASKMYEGYLNRIGADIRDTTEVPFLISIRNNGQLTKLVDQLTSDLTVDVVKEIIHGGPDYKLQRYYTYMSSRYNLRDSISRTLLVYRTGIVDDYIEELQQATQLYEMRVSYYQDSNNPDYDLVEGSIFGGSNIFGIR